MPDLLFEIGTEEIPAGFLQRALPELARMAEDRLREARLLGAGAANVRTLGTPRRLALMVRDLADRQPDLSERVVGPPVQAAYDAAGKPTKAAIGFAAKNGVDIGALERSEVPGKKGQYVVCTRREPGRPAAEVLPALLEGLIRAMPWPKSMRWGMCEDAFVRPVHWLVALLGGQVLPVSFAGVTAGRETRGHRFLSPGPIALAGDEASYLEALRGAFVIADPDDRKQAIAAELARIESETGARVRPDPALVDEVAFLVEYPVGICGAFDDSFLEVPPEVIVSAMRSHQRYFALEDESGALVNRFATVAGTVTVDPAVVRAGNERVLAARLSDARFFFREDRKKSLDEHAAKLEDVVFQSKLGTIAAKVGRIAEIAGWLARQVGVDEAAVGRAARLCKADLVTQMVFEFPDLQGIMGAHYARLQGEPAAVADAIREHYAPRGAGDEPPAGEIGAVLAIADRADTLVGCFAVKLQPTGSADPYGLRRAAMGILTITLARGWSVPLSGLVGRAAAALSGVVPAGDDCVASVLGYLRTRLRGMLADGEGLAADCVESALSARFDAGPAAGFDDVPDARARARAVAALRDRADFEPLAVAFKRVANILKGEAAPGAVDPGKFAEDEERALHEAFVGIARRAEARIDGGDYRCALQILAELKEPVDRFFDTVLVMDENLDVRRNRLALLGQINATFARIADFRQLAV